MAVWIRQRKKPGTSPDTLCGQWLRAFLLNDDHLRMQLHPLLNGGKKRGWNDDEPAVVQAVCELGVRRFFGDRYEPHVVSEFVTQMRDNIARSETPPEQEPMEAVVREALGDNTADISQLRPYELHVLRGVVTMAVCSKLNLGEPEINEMIVAGERLARERGFAPLRYAAKTGLRP